MLRTLPSLVLVLVALQMPLQARAQCKASPSYTASGAALSFIRVHDGLLSLRVADLPLHVVLAEIGRLSGVELVVDPAITATISAAFINVPVDDGLKRLVRQADVAGFVLIYDSPSAAAPLQTALKKAIVLAPASEVRTAPRFGRQAPADADGRQTVDPRTEALAVLGAKRDVLDAFETHLIQQDPETKHQSFKELMALFSDDDLHTLITLLEDHDFEAEAWQAALRPLQDVVTPNEAEAMRLVLTDGSAREVAADFLRQLIEERRSGPDN